MRGRQGPRGSPPQCRRAAWWLGERSSIKFTYLRVLCAILHMIIGYTCPKHVWIGWPKHRTAHRCHPPGPALTSPTFIHHSNSNPTPPLPDISPGRPPHLPGAGGRDWICGLPVDCPIVTGSCDRVTIPRHPFRYPHVFLSPRLVRGGREGGGGGGAMGGAEFGE